MRRADNLNTFMYQLSRNLGASTSWNPKGLSRSVMGLLYLCFTFIYIYIYIYISFSRHVNTEFHCLAESVLIVLRRYWNFPGLYQTSGYMYPVIVCPGIQTRFGYSGITSTKSASFCVTAFSASLTNLTFLLPQSRDCSCYVSRRILAATPL